MFEVRNVVEFKNRAIMWNPTIHLGRSLRWSPGTTILVSPKLTPTILDHGIIMQGRTQFLLLKISDGDVLRIVNVSVAQTSCGRQYSMQTWLLDALGIGM